MSCFEGTPFGGFKRECKKGNPPFLGGPLKRKTLPSGGVQLGLSGFLGVAVPQGRGSLEA